MQNKIRFKIPQNGDLRALQDWSLNLEKGAKGPVDQLRLHLAGARSVWNMICAAAKSYVQLLGVMSGESKPDLAIADFRAQLVAIGNSLSRKSEFEQVISAFKLLNVMSPRLGFIGDGLGELSNMMLDMRASLTELLAELDEL